MSHPYLSAVIDLVRQAGEAILPHWRSELDVQTKTDESPVTVADMAAHQVLLDGLMALDSAIPVLSEEDCEVPLSERAGWTRWWLVDPLDGTKEFIAGSEEFTVNVALIEAGKVRFGVVGIPASGRCYYGGKDFGAWRSEPDGAAQALRVRQHPTGAFTVVASRRHSSSAKPDASSDSEIDSLADIPDMSDGDDLPAESASEEGTDPVLLEIFASEALRNLALIEEWLQR